MTRAGAAASEPFDLGEISRSGDLLDGLAARRNLDPAADDPAVRLLAALIADVDAGAPPLPAPPPRVACTAAKPGRPVVRAFVTFGAATLMLTSAGSAVAGAGADHGKKADGPAVQKLDVSERSTGDVGVRALPADRGSAPVMGAPGARRPSASATRDRPGAGGSRPAATQPGTPVSAPPQPVGGVDGPIAGGPYGPAPLPTPSPSVPSSSPPATSVPTQSPPAGPPVPSSAPSAAGEMDSATARGSARDSAADSAGSSTAGTARGTARDLRARLDAARGGSGKGRTTA